MYHCDIVIIKMKITKKTLKKNNFEYVKTVGVIDIFEGYGFLIEVNRHCGTTTLRKIIDIGVSLYITDVTTFDDIEYYTSYHN